LAKKDVLIVQRQAFAVCCAAVLGPPNAAAKGADAGRTPGAGGQKVGILMGKNGGLHIYIYTDR